MRSMNFNSESSNLLVPKLSGFTHAAKGRNYLTVGWNTPQYINCMVLAVAGTSMPINENLLYREYLSSVWNWVANSNFTNATAKEDVTGSTGIKLCYQDYGNTVTITGLSRYSYYTFALYPYVANSGQMIFGEGSFLTTRTNL